MAAKAAPKKTQAKKPIGPIAKGKLHKAMGVKPGKKLDPTTVDSELAALKAKKNKTAAEVKKERELQFAVNARSFSKRKPAKP